MEVKKSLQNAESDRAGDKTLSLEIIICRQKLKFHLKVKMICFLRLLKEPLYGHEMLGRYCILSSDSFDIHNDIMVSCSDFLCS